MRLFFTITTRNDFTSSQIAVKYIASIYMTINALVIGGKWVGSVAWPIRPTFIQTRFLLAQPDLVRAAGHGPK